MPSKIRQLRQLFWSLGSSKHSTVKTRKNQLSAVIYDTMASNGFAVSDFKFKVLTFKSKGYEFIALIEMVHALGERTLELQYLGALIKYQSQHRFGVLIKGVFWQMSVESEVHHPETAWPATAWPQTSQLAYRKSNPTEKPLPTQLPATQAEQDFDRELSLFSSLTGSSSYASSVSGVQSLTSLPP